MTWQYTPYIIPILIAAVVSGAVAVLAWQRRQIYGATPLLFMMLSITQWLIFYVLEIGSTTLEGNLLWANVAYVGIVFGPVAWLFFAFEYTNPTKKVTWRTAVPFIVEPLFILLIAWTDGLHHLFRASVTLDSSGPFAYLVIERGPIFWVHVAYSYGVLAYGTYLLIRAYFHTSGLYRAQIGVSVLGAFVPWIINILYISPVAAMFIIDPTPIAFMVTGVMFAWGIFGYRLMDISPVARNSVIEQMDDGMFVVDTLYRVVDVNSAGQAILRKPINQIIGLPVEEVFDEWAKLVAQYRDVERANTQIRFTTGGQMLYYNLNISPLHDKHGRMTGRLVMLSNNTEQRKGEIALREAKEAAEAASRAKSTFLANMSHELRTPLTAIIGYAELLQEQTAVMDDTNLPQRLEKISVSADHLLHIINDLLDLSKVEAGQMKLSISSFSITSVIESAQVVVQPMLSENKNQLTINLNLDNDTMQADQAKVRQVLLNILHNAAKFTHDGEIILTVERDPENTAQLLFEIIDNGIGMSEIQVKQLFRPFFQADLSPTRRYGGTGLGLAISYHLCKLMHGDIQVKSELGKGTCFKIFLPRVTPDVIVASNGQADKPLAEGIGLS
jgi:signal transduction histidine kinase